MTASPPPAFSHPASTSPSWVDLAAGLAPVLAEVAGEGARLVSVSLDVSPEDPGCAEPRFAARLDRGGRSIAFVSGEARALDGRLLAAASAVFKRG